MSPKLDRDQMSARPRRTWSVSPRHRSPTALHVVLAKLTQISFDLYVTKRSDRVLLTGLGPETRSL